MEPIKFHDFAIGRTVMRIASKIPVKPKMPLNQAQSGKLEGW
jgi:hypothetical protein